MAHETVFADGPSPKKIDAAISSAAKQVADALAKPAKTTLEKVPSPSKLTTKIINNATTAPTTLPKSSSKDTAIAGFMGMPLWLKIVISIIMIIFALIMASSLVWCIVKESRKWKRQREFRKAEDKARRESEEDARKARINARRYTDRIDREELEMRDMYNGRGRKEEEEERENECLEARDGRGRQVKWEDVELM